MAQQTSMPQPPPTPPIRSHLKKYKNLAMVTIVTLAIIIVTVILISPIIPIQSQYIVTKTRTRDLQYNTGIYNQTINQNMTSPPFVNVTNQDSIGGNFSVTINYQNFLPHILPNESQHIIDTFSQSIFIDAGDTKSFTPPKSGWGGMVASFTGYSYFVFPPTTQENYNVTETRTEYKSILNLLLGS